MTSFQIEHPLVLEYRQKDNIKQTVLDSSKNIAVVYFSGHSIYFPNDEFVFQREIVERDRYEWTNPLNNFQNSGLNVYVRDVFKQWYIDGVSTRVDTIERLAEELKTRVGKRSLITVGSSAGGYAATLFGSLLGAQAVYCFAGQFDLEREALIDGMQSLSPLIWKYRDVPEKSRYYHLAPFIKQASSVPILYFLGIECAQDRIQYETVRQCPNLFTFPIRSKVHGVPINTFDLAKLFERQLSDMYRLSERLMAHPLTQSQLSIQEFGLAHFTKNCCQKSIRHLRRRAHLAPAYE